MPITVDTEGDEKVVRSPKDPDVYEPVGSGDSPQTTYTPSSAPAETPYAPAGSPDRSFGRAPAPTPPTKAEEIARYLEETTADEQYIDKTTKWARRLPTTRRYLNTSLLDRAEVVEAATNGKLPPEIAVALAQVDAYENDLKAVARELLREESIPLDHIFGSSLRKYGVKDRSAWKIVGPTGELIDFDTIKSQLPRIERQYLMQLLAQPTENGQQVVVRGGKGTANVYRTGAVTVDPIRMLKFYNTLEERYGRDLSFRAGLGAAMGLAADKIGPRKFAENLDIIRNTLPDVKGAKQIGLAHLATAAKVDTANPDELIKFRLMVKSKLSDSQMKLVEEMMAKSDEELADEDTHTLYNKQTYEEGDAEIEDSLLDLRATMRRPDSDDAVLKAYRNFIDQVERFQQSEEAKVTWEDIPGVSNTFHWAGNQLHRLENFSGAVWGMTIATGNHAARVIQEGFAGTLEENGEELQAHWADSYDEAQKIWSQDKDFAQWAVESEGWSQTMAVLGQFVGEVFLDPTIVGGKLFALSKGAKYFRLSKLYDGAFMARNWSKMSAKLMNRKYLSLGQRSISRFFVDEAVAALNREDDALGYLRYTSKGYDELWEAGPASREAFRTNLVEDIAAGRINPGDIKEAYFADVWDHLKSQPWEKGSVEDVAKRILADNYAETLDTHTLYGVHQTAAEGSRRGQYIDRIEGAFQHRWRNQRMKTELLDGIYDYVAYARREGLSAQRMEEDVRDLMLLALDAKSIEGTNIEKYLIGAKTRWNEARKEADVLGLAGRAPQNEAELEAIAELSRIKADISFFQGINDGWRAGDSGAALHNYVPKPTLRGAVLRNLGPNDSRLRSALSALNNSYVGPVIDIEKNLDQQVSRMLTRSRVYRKPGEVQVWVARVKQAARLDNPNRAQAVRQVVEAMNRDMVMRTAGDMGIPSGIAEALTLRVMDEMAERNRLAMGIEKVGDEEKVVEDILWETQELNRVMVLDPLDVRQQFARYRGITNRIKNGYRKLGVDVDIHIDDVQWNADGTLAEQSKSLPREVIDIAGEINRSILKKWKPAVVIAPRYIFRVPGMEEQLRFFADLSFLDRLTATKTYARGMSRLEKGKGVFARAAQRASRVEFVLDERSSLSLANSIRDAGFESIDEAIDVINKGVRDPRLASLDVLDVERLKGARFQNKGVDLSGTVLDQDFYVPDMTGSVGRLGHNLPHGTDFGAGPGIYATTKDTFPGPSTPSRTRLRVTAPLSNNLPSNELLADIRSRFVGQIPDQQIDDIVAEITGKQNVWETLEKHFPGEADDILQDMGYDAIWGASKDGQHQYVRVFDQDQVVLYGEKPQFIIRQRIPRAGEFVDEGDIGSGLAYSAFHDLKLKHTRTYAGDMNAKLTKIGPGEAGYIDTWAHHLNNQVARSEFGKAILRGVANGLNEDELVRLGVRWIDEMRRTEKGNAILKRMGLNPLKDGAAQISGVRVRVEQAGDLLMLSAREVDSRQLAKLALNNNLPTKLLHKVSHKGKYGPTIVGWKTSNLTGATKEAGIISRVTDNIAENVLQKPTNFLSRQPFFKKWYNKAQRLYIRQAKQAGIELTPQKLKAIEREARLFALERVQDVMFDFREEGRIAEMFSFAAPFMQPWMEQYQVWGRIIADKPYLIGYGKVAYENAIEAGIIQTDEDTGQKYVPMFPFNILGNMLINSAVGEAGNGEGWSVMGNLANFNFFTQNTYNIGGVTVPLPGLSPQIMIGAQGLLNVFGDKLPDWLEWRAKDWAFTYGNYWSKPSALAEAFIPTWAKKFLDKYDPEVYNQWANRIIQGWYADGFTPQQYVEYQIAAKNPNYIKSDMTKADQIRLARDEMKAMAVGSAKSLLLRTALMQTITPTSPAIQTSVRPLYKEWYDLREQYGNDYYGALEEWQQRYKNEPGKWAIPVSTTFWKGNPTEDDFDPAVLREAGPIPLPTSSFVQQIWEDEEFKSYAQGDPMLAWMLLPRGAFKQERSDLQGRLWQVEEGWRGTKDPLTFIEDADEAIMYAQKQAIYASWSNEEEMLKKFGLEYGDPIYMLGGVKNGITFKGLEARNAALDDIDELYPNTKDKYAAANIDQYVHLSLEYLMQNTAVSHSPLGRATIKYLEWRNEKMDWMQRHNYDNGDYEVMEKLREERDMVMADIEERFPEWTIAKSVFFSDDFEYGKEMPAFGHTLDTKEETFKQWVQADETRRNWYTGWQQRWNNTFDPINNPSLQAIGEVDGDYYLRLRNLQMEAERRRESFGFNPQMREWKEGRTPEYKKSYLINASTRYAPYLGYFDKQVLGIKTSLETEERWAAVAAFEVRMDKMDLANAQTDKGKLYERRDQLVKQYMKEDPLFRQQVINANKWGYNLFTFSPYTREGAKAKESKQSKAWDYLQNFVWEVQQEWTKHEVRGFDDFNNVSAQYARDSVLEIREYVDYLREQSPLFDRQVNRISEETGKDLVEIIVPPFYFPLGGRYPTMKEITHDV